VLIADNSALCTLPPCEALCIALECDTSYKVQLAPLRLCLQRKHSSRCVPCHHFYMLVLCVARALLVHMQVLCKYCALRKQFERMQPVLLS
jgi:hypothetical protein